MAIPTSNAIVSTTLSLFSKFRIWPQFIHLIPEFRFWLIFEWNSGSCKGFLTYLNKIRSVLDYPLSSHILSTEEDTIRLVILSYGEPRGLRHAVVLVRPGFRNRMFYAKGQETDCKLMILIAIRGPDQSLYKEHVETVSLLNYLFCMTSIGRIKNFCIVVTIK